MAHLNYSDFYQVPDLTFDISKLRLDLTTVLKTKGFTTPEKVSTFGAIPLNQLPNDEESIKGHNVRGTSWPVPDD